MRNSRNQRARTAVGFSVLVGMAHAACAGDATTLFEVESVNSTSLSEEVGELNGDLSLGSRGPEVQYVYDYLAQYGYFPSDELAELYPRWEPVVAQAPVDQAFFDGRMEEAVLQLQARTGLAQTGVVDAATRGLIRSPRCGFPESGAERVEKFALFNPISLRWPDREITWRVMNSDKVQPGDPPALPFETVKQIAFAAFKSWSDQMSLRLKETSGSPDIPIVFGFVDGRRNGALGRTSSPPNGDIVMDEEENWSVAAPFQSALLHEIGHALGLDHSTTADAMMVNGFRGTGVTLALDDNVAISALYDKWQLLPGRAVDIGVGAGGHAWIIGSTGGVHRWTGSSWETVPGSGTRIAVEPGGVPWIVNASGNIYRRNSAAGGSVSWTQQPGCATDIGIGANDAVWITGCGGFGDGFRVFKFNGRCAFCTRA